MDITRICALFLLRRLHLFLSIRGEDFIHCIHNILNIFKIVTRLTIAQTVYTLNILWFVPNDFIQ